MSGYSFDAADRHEQYSGDTYDGQSNLQVISNGSSNTSPPIPEDWRHLHGSTSGILQGWDQGPTLVTMDLQQMNGLQYDAACLQRNTTEHLLPPGCISPSALAMPEIQYDASSRIMEYSFQHASAEAYVGSSLHTDVPDYNRVGNTHAQTTPSYAFETTGPIDNQQGHDTWPENSFIPGVLGREVGYQEALSENTDDLLNRLAMPSGDDRSMGYKYGMPTGMISELRDATMVEYSGDRTVPDQSPNSVEAQQLLDAMTNRFRLRVREGTPVDVNPNASSSKSVRTSNGQLDPSGGLYYSGDVPSPTSTATTTDVTYCPKCVATFSGNWQRSNLKRHLRLKHVGEEVVRYACEITSCGKVFFRTDARLKHYRKKHPNLRSGSTMSRGVPSSTGSDQRELHHSRSGHSHSSS